MNTPAQIFVKLSLCLCCVLVFAAFVLLLCSEGGGAAGYRLSCISQTLTETPAGVLLLTGIGVVILHFGP